MAGAARFLAELLLRCWDLGSMLFDMVLKSKSLFDHLTYHRSWGYKSSGMQPVCPHPLPGSQVGFH